MQKSAQALERENPQANWTLEQADGKFVVMDYKSQIQFAHRVATGFLGDPFQAEDVVQNVLLRIVKQNETAPAIRDMQQYLYTAIRRECARASRKSDLEHEKLIGIRRDTRNVDPARGEFHDEENIVGD